jgi:hypothetical protein
MCSLRAWFLGIGIVLMLSNLLIKEWKIYKIFQSIEKLQTDVVPTKLLLIATGTLVGIVVVRCIECL